VKDPNVRLVLDTTAILAYAGASIHVGETIAEVVDEGGQFGVPTICLAEASRLIPDKLAEGINLLVRHTQCVVLSALAEDWTALVAWTRIVGRVDLAAALIEATDRSACWVISGEAELYGDDRMPVIGI
jgi:hypothetical protein